MTAIGKPPVACRRPPLRADRASARIGATRRSAGLDAAKGCVMDTQQKSETVEVDQARQRLDELVEAVTRDRARVRLVRDGRPVAVLVSARDLALIEQAERARARRSALLERMRAPFRDVPAEEIEHEVAKALAGVRAEMGTDREQAAGAGG